MKITGIYAAIAALLIVFLAIRVVAFRRSSKIGLGDDNNPEMRKRIRAHGNAIEYLPVGLFLLLILELNQTAPILLHCFGIVLIFARVCHAWGVSHHSGLTPGRMIGVLLTFGLLIVMSLLLLWQFFAMALITSSH
ncbi:MAG: MAPEG family protein [Rudaea sp.]